MIAFQDDVASYPLATSQNLSENINIWIERYSETLKAKKLSEKTIKSYHDSLNTFLDFTKMYPIPIDTISARYINRYLIYLQYQKIDSPKLTKKEREILKDEYETDRSLGKNDNAFTVFSPFENTLNHRLTVLKGFLKYISEENKDLHDFTRLFSHLAKIKISEKFTDYITKKELNEILSFMQSWTTSYKKYHPRSSEVHAYRNAFLVVLYAITGARSSEIIYVKLEDFTEAKIDNKLGYIIRINKGKGGKKRKVFAPKKQIDFYLSYLNSHLPSKEYFISSSYANNTWSNKPIDDGYIRKFSNHILAILNINKSGLHIFRRGYVSKRIGQDKVDVSLVAKEVGNTISILEKHYLKHTLGEEEL